MDKSGITPEDILRRAREIITPRDRWIKHDYFSDGRYCALGAIGRAAHEMVGRHSDERVTAAVALLDKAVPQRYRGLISLWNDVTSRTHKEVLRAFDEAIGGK